VNYYLKPSFYRFASSCLIVYDITNRESYDEAPIWIEEIHRYAREEVIIALVGNKCDLEDKRQVSFDEACKLAEKHSN
jgi:GTPase SAR1 family protein